jgi:YegS/Rv2252/BmrU family lipid kinase
VVVVVLNSNAGAKVRGPGRAPSAEQVHDLFASRGIDAKVVPSDSAEVAQRVARDAIADGAEMVVAAGGDGTVGIVATELIANRAVALGILPLGSVMNVARMLGIPRDVEQAADVIAEGRTRLIDVGEANGVTFYEATSVGLNAAIFGTAHHFEDGDWGSPLKGLWVALRYRPARMKITLDSEEVATRALMVTVSNGAYTGIGMTVAPDARLDDGRFDVRVFRHFSKVELLRHLASIAFGRRRYSPHVSTYRSARVRIESRHPLPVRADAQELGTTPVECESKKGALKVIVGPDFVS